MSQTAEQVQTAGLLAAYDHDGYYCELFGEDRNPAPGAAVVIDRLDQLEIGLLRERARDAELELFNYGITFTVYTEKDAIDRILPFDVIPRIIPRDEWARIEAGVTQRVETLNRFLHDIYHDARILKDGLVPRELVEKNANYRAAMRGLELKHDTYVHICGTDLVRGGDGNFYVLEDNARTPSGVSYVVENRHLMQRTFADFMRNLPIRPVSNYGQRLHEKLAELAPEHVPDPQVALLTPGTYNSAYFEHVFLSREMGVPLVEGRDLVVDDDDKVHMRTVRGLEPVHVIYRRIDDNFLDPEVFNPTSVLGVPGIMRAYAKGNVALANAVGTGVADDKAIYAYMPRITEYYLGEEAILSNVETHICREPEALQYTLDHLEDLVVKPVGESGGYGITVGPRASKKELEDCREQLMHDPAKYISQPMVNLSVCPTLVDGGIEPRHVDLRPFAVTGKETWVMPGGLTRVALRKGSIVVNSSQGGGSKDTWVLE